MKKKLTFTFIILSYNILLLIIPLLIFLVSLNLSNKALIDIIICIYCLFVLLSPVLTVILGYHVAKDEVTPFGWLTPIIINFVGFSPFLLLYLLLSSLWSPLDYILIVFLPILLGLLANFAALVNNSLHLF